MISFIYNGKNYTTNNLQNKLMKMGITEQDIIIPNKLIDSTPEWKLEGKVKHRWINKNPNSKEYNYSIIGIHNPGIIPNKPTHLMDNPDDWKYEEVK